MCSCWAGKRTRLENSAKSSISKIFFKMKNHVGQIISQLTGPADSTKITNND